MNLSEQEKSIFEYHDLIEAIVAALEIRDYHTAHHSERVSNMTEWICKQMKLCTEEIRLYHIAADLHDIGKIGIADAVLLKAEPLNDAEWKQMQAHTTIGDYILKKVHRFSAIARIVRHHHERWDGKGYPDQLSKETIPLGARVIAVADSMDAMLSDRSYRKALSSDLCRHEIEKNIGLMYDPEIAAVVLANWNEILAVRQSTLSLRNSSPDGLPYTGLVERNDMKEGT